LPVATVEQGTVPGRAGKLATHSPPVPFDRAVLEPTAGERLT